MQLFAILAPMLRSLDKVLRIRRPRPQLLKPGGGLKQIKVELALLRVSVPLPYSTGARPPQDRAPFYAAVAV